MVTFPVSVKCALIMHFYPKISRGIGGELANLMCFGGSCWIRQARPSAWFFEFPNILKLQDILSKFDISIKNIGPIYVPDQKFKRIESHYKFTRIGRSDFYKFKDISNLCFAFDDGYYKDKETPAFYDKD